MRSRTPFVTVAATLVGAVALSACSPAEAGPQAPTDTEYVVEDAAAEATRGAEAVAPELRDPCTLITAAELTDVLGVEFSEGVYNGFLSTETETICEWNAAGEVYSSVQVTLRTTEGDAAAERAAAEQSYGATVDAVVPGATGAFAAQEGTVVGFVTDGLAVYVLHYTDVWEDLTDETAAIAALVAEAL